MPRPSSPSIDRLLEHCLDDHRSKFLLPPIGHFQALYLLAVVKLGEGAYGRNIHSFFDEVYKRKDVNVGQIYSTGATLVEQGLLLAENVPNPHGQGRPVVVYTLTNKGRAILGAAQTYFTMMSSTSDAA